jgi:hypothetical protein
MDHPVTLANQQLWPAHIMKTIAKKGNFPARQGLSPSILHSDGGSTFLLKTPSFFFNIHLTCLIDLLSVCQPALPEVSNDGCRSTLPSAKVLDGRVTGLVRPITASGG